MGARARRIELKLATVERKMKPQSDNKRKRFRLASPTRARVECRRRRTAAAACAPACAPPRSSPQPPPRPALSLRAPPRPRRSRHTLLPSGRYRRPRAADQAPGNVGRNELASGQLGSIRIGTTVRSNSAGAHWSASRAGVSQMTWGSEWGSTEKRPKQSSQIVTGSARGRQRTFQSRIQLADAIVKSARARSR